MENVENLGAEGDVVSVADGYARNFLIPKRLAAPVTEAARRRLEKLREQREIERKTRMDEARALAKRIKDASCTIPVKVGQEDKLYGSVTTMEIADALEKQGIKIDRHTLQLDQPIKELGVFDVKVKLHPEVDASIKVWVVEE